MEKKIAWSLIENMKTMGVSICTNLMEVQKSKEILGIKLIKEHLLYEVA